MRAPREVQVINKMVLSNLLHRPVRTFVSILAVAIEVSMVLLVVGLTTGTLQETAKRVEGVGAEIMVQPPGASFLMALTAAPMPVKIGERLAELPRVYAVAPVLISFNASGTGGLNLIYGIDMESFNRVSRGFVYHAGGPFEQEFDVIVDDWYAKAHKVEVGQTINLLSHDFRVVGIVEHGKGSRVFIPLATAQDLFGSKDRASIFYVRCTDPSFTQLVKKEIRELLPKHEVRPIKEYLSLMTSNNLPALNSFIAVMISVAVSIGFLVIFLSMYTTITERTREIGILKSLGASKGYIMSVILRETTLVCLLGIATGVVGTIFAKRAITEISPTIAILLTVEWAIWASLLALGGGLLGGIYPALRAAHADPVDALGYE